MIGVRFHDAFLTMNGQTSVFPDIGNIERVFRQHTPTSHTFPTLFGICSSSP
jgi:hypothetical protein